MGDVTAPKIALITGLEFEAALARKVLKKSDCKAPVFVSGLGAPFAKEVVTKAKQAGAKGVISFGVCGGLDPALNAGSVILPETVLGSEPISVDLAWRDRLHAQLVSQFDIATGKLLSVEKTVESVAEKQTLYKNTGARAVDMESSLLARQAAKQGLSFVAVRVVHDPASQSIPPAFADMVKSNGQIDGWKLVKGLVFNWPGFGQLKQMSENDLQARTNLQMLTRLALPTFSFTG